MPNTNASSATPSAPSSDRYERTILLDATPSRVWRALTDVSQFNAWFGVQLTSGFAPGAEVSGHITIRNYEHVVMRIWIEAMEPERFFSFRWHPHAVEKETDYAVEPTTLVAFTIEPADSGTKLTIVESGFDAIPESRRASAFAGISQGWPVQLENIRTYLAT